MRQTRQDSRKARTLRAAVMCLLFALLCGALLPLSCAAAEEDPIATNNIEGWPKAKARSSDYICLLDTTTGTVLLDKNMDVQTPPASLTKIMTTLLAIENGNLDDYVEMTEAGLAYAVSGSSNLYTVEGESFQLRDMLYGVMLASANDMATQVAEYIGGGSVDRFVEMMNERAAELGCTGTHFENACGMPADGHVSTAHDMALISQAALENETFRKIANTTNYTIPATAIYAAREITNHHPCMADPVNNELKGCIGGKTGYTDLAGSCLATFCDRKGRTIVCITLHAGDLATAVKDTKKLFAYAYTKWKAKKAPLAEGEELLEGGKVLVPKGSSVSDCAMEETVTYQGEDFEIVDRTYYWSGVEVGSCKISRKKTETTSVAAAAAAESADASAQTAVATGTADASAQTAAPASSADHLSAGPAQPGADESGIPAQAETETQTQLQAQNQAQQNATFAAEEKTLENVASNSVVRIVLIAGLILLGIILLLLAVLLLRKKP